MTVAFGYYSYRKYAGFFGECFRNIKLYMLK